MLREHGSLASVLADLRKKQTQREKEVSEGKKKLSAGLGKIDVPSGWRWEAAKEVFRNPDVVKAGEVKVSSILLRRGHRWRKTRRSGTNASSLF